MSSSLISVVKGMRVLYRVATIHDNNDSETERDTTFDNAQQYRAGPLVSSYCRYRQSHCRRRWINQYRDLGFSTVDMIVYDNNDRVTDLGMLVGGDRFVVFFVCRISRQ